MFLPKKIVLMKPLTLWDLPPKWMHVSLVVPGKIVKYSLLDKHLNLNLTKKITITLCYKLSKMLSFLKNTGVYLLIDLIFLPHSFTVHHDFFFICRGVIWVDVILFADNLALTSSRFCFWPPSFLWKNFNFFLVWANKEAIVNCCFCLFRHFRKRL